MTRRARTGCRPGACSALILALFLTLAGAPAAHATAPAFHACEAYPRNKMEVFGDGSDRPALVRAPSASERHAIDAAVAVAERAFAAGDETTALQSMEKARLVMTATYGADHPVMGRWTVRVGEMMTDLVPKIGSDAAIYAERYTIDGADILIKSLGACNIHTLRAIDARAIGNYVRDGDFHSATADMQEVFLSRHLLFPNGSPEVQRGFAAARRLGLLHAGHGDRPDWGGIAHVAAGEFLMMYGDCQAAAPLFDAALSLQRGVNGDHPNRLWTDAFIRLAAARQCLGESRTALFAARNALEANARAAPDQRGPYPEAQIEIGQMLLSLGDAQGVTRVLDTLSAMNDAGPRLDPWVQLDMRGLYAGLETLRGHYGEAADYAEARLRLYSRLAPEEGPHELVRSAEVHLGYAMALYRFEDIPPAVRYAREGLAAARAIYRPQSSRLAAAELVAATIFSGPLAERADRAEGEKLLADARTAFLAIEGEQGMNVAACDKLAAAIALHRHDLVGAAGSARRALAVFAAEDRRTRLGRAEGNGLVLTSSLDREIRETAGLLLDARLGLKTSDDEEVFAGAQLGGLRQADAAVNGAAALRFAERMGFGAKAREREQMLAEREQIDAALVALPPGDMDEKGRALSLRARALSDALDAGDAALSAGQPDYFEFLAPGTLSLAELRRPLTKAAAGCHGAMLGCDEALVQIVQAGPSVYVLVATSEGFAWARATMAAAGIGNAVHQLRCSLDAKNCRGETSQPFRRVTSWRLYQALFGDARVLALLSSKPVWLVTSNGALSTLPLTVLVTQKPEGPDDNESFAHGTHWLIESTTVVTLPAVASLRILRGEPAALAGTSPPMPFVGFAPRFDGPSSPINPPTRETAPRFRSGPEGLASVRGLPALSNVEEIEALQQMLGGIPVVTGATEEKVRALEDDGRGPLAHASVIAFATHGLISGEFSFLGEPALALTPPAVPRATSPEQDDGLLTASEIAGFRLTADWIILAACNTASGATPDAEGLSGLARAFFFAGAHSLLVSHWRVDDSAARFLVTRSVELARPGGSSHAQALRQAQLEMLHGTASIAPLASVRTYLADPRYWAPMFIVGD